jgi:hypothetical protein
MSGVAHEGKVKTTTDTVTKTQVSVVPTIQNGQGSEHSEVEPPLSEFRRYAVPIDSVLELRLQHPLMKMLMAREYMQMADFDAFKSVEMGYQSTLSRRPRLALAIKGALVNFEHEHDQLNKERVALLTQFSDGLPIVDDDKMKPWLQTIQRHEQMQRDRKFASTQMRFMMERWTIWFEDQMRELYPEDYLVQKTTATKVVDVAEDVVLQKIPAFAKSTYSTVKEELGPEHTTRQRVVEAAACGGLGFTAGRLAVMQWPTLTRESNPASGGMVHWLQMATVGLGLTATLAAFTVDITQVMKTVHFATAFMGLWSFLQKSWPKENPSEPLASEMESIPKAVDKIANGHAELKAIERDWGADIAIALTSFVVGFWIALPWGTTSRVVASVIPSEQPKVVTPVKSAPIQVSEVESVFHHPMPPVDIQVSSNVTPSEEKGKEPARLVSMDDPKGQKPLAPPVAIVVPLCASCKVPSEFSKDHRYCFNCWFDWADGNDNFGDGPLESALIGAALNSKEYRARLADRKQKQVPQEDSPGGSEPGTGKKKKKKKPGKGGKGGEEPYDPNPVVLKPGGGYGAETVKKVGPPPVEKLVGSLKSCDWCGLGNHETGEHKCPKCSKLGHTSKMCKGKQPAEKAAVVPKLGEPIKKMCPKCHCPWHAGRSCAAKPMQPGQKTVRKQPAVRHLFEKLVNVAPSEVVEWHRQDLVQGNLDYKSLTQAYLIQFAYKISPILPAMFALGDLRVETKFGQGTAWRSGRWIWTCGHVLLPVAVLGQDHTGAKLDGITVWHPYSAKKWQLTTVAYYRVAKPYGHADAVVACSVSGEDEHEMSAILPNYPMKAWTDIPASDWATGEPVGCSGYNLGVHQMSSGIAHNSIAKISTGFGVSGAAWRVLRWASNFAVGVHVMGTKTQGNGCIPLTDADVAFVTGQAPKAKPVPATGPEK